MVKRCAASPGCPTITDAGYMSSGSLRSSARALLAARRRHELLDRLQAAGLRVAAGARPARAAVPQQAGDASQIVFRANTGTLNDRAQRAQVERVVRSVAGLPSVVAVRSPYAGPGAISRDGRTAFATVQFNRTADQIAAADVERVVTTAQRGATARLQVNLGGPGDPAGPAPGVRRRRRASGCSSRSSS